MAGATASANTRTLTFAAATTAMTTIGVIGGNWVNDRSRTNERLQQQENALVLPREKVQTTELSALPAYTFDKI